MLSLSIILLSSCERTITLDPKPFDEIVSIVCLLTPNTTPQLNLYRTVSFFAPDQELPTLFARNANVEISSVEGIDYLQMDSLYNKYYCRWEYFYSGTVEIKTNLSYQLNIDFNGKSYNATTTTNVIAPKIDSVTYIEEFQDIFGQHEGVVVDFSDEIGPNYYRYQMDRLLDTSTLATLKDNFVPCIINDETYPISEVGRFVYFDTGKDGLPVKFIVEPAYKHREGNVGTVIIQSLDKISADFFNSLDEQRLGTVNPFVEPVFLKSSIEGAVGVFGTISPSEGVEFVFPD